MDATSHHIKNKKQKIIICEDGTIEFENIEVVKFKNKDNEHCEWIAYNNVLDGSVAESDTWTQDYKYQLTEKDVKSMFNNIIKDAISRTFTKNRQKTQTPHKHTNECKEIEDKKKKCKIIINYRDSSIASYEYRMTCGAIIEDDRIEEHHAICKGEK